MEYLRIILFVLAVLSIIATLIAYFKVRNELKIGKENQDAIKEDNNEIPKEIIEKYVKIFTILTVVTGILSLAAIVFNIVYKAKNFKIEDANSGIRNVVLDINPVIELTLNENYYLVEMKALDEDAKRVVDENFKGKDFDETIDFIRDKLVLENFIPVDDDLFIILCSPNNNIDLPKIEEKVRGSFSSKDIRIDITRVDKVNDDDIKLAKEKNISVCKASYINSILKENNDVTIDYLLESSVRNLHEAKDIGRYCNQGYFLDGDTCLKEVGREKTKTGKVCPEGYSEYNGKCYRDGHFTETEKETCYDVFTLKDGKCVRTESRKAEGVCENGKYDIPSDKCIVKTYTGNATEYCLDSGRTLYEHKCLATKPTLNGGCTGSDVVYKGKCVNMKNDFVGSDWKCTKGIIIDPMDGNIPEDGYKCYLESKVNPTSYKCDEKFTLSGKTCLLVEERRVDKVRVCETGYTITKDGRCLNLKDSKAMQDGLTCDNPNSRMKNDICIIYDMVEANYSK